MLAQLIINSILKGNNNRSSREIIFIFNNSSMPVNSIIRKDEQLKYKIYRKRITYQIKNKQK